MSNHPCIALNALATGGRVPPRTKRLEMQVPVSEDRRKAVSDI